MRAARAFREALIASGVAFHTRRIETTLFGSLAWTGRGHATDKAVVLGLQGYAPDGIDPNAADAIYARAIAREPLAFDAHYIRFDIARDVLFDTVTPPPAHPNTLSFRALDEQGATIREERWLSVGGGFVLREGEDGDGGQGEAPDPYPFANGAQLLALGARYDLSIAQIQRANECARRPADDVAAHVRRVRETMLGCVERGLSQHGDLPGGLKVRRRAAAIYDQLEASRLRNIRVAHEAMEYLSVYAMAANEENAAGGRVVTAPTNGAAGVVPSVLRYFRDFIPGASPQAFDTFLMTATAVGALFKLNASISGAEVGCQGEVGVASSMAAAGLTAVLGGSNAQIENAAEIAMEHHLGLTCDPIGGLVQIPCIERNAFGAVKAVNAASLALRGDGQHRVSLDSVIRTMRETGRDMHHKYKETSLGGLAVNWVEC
jgi:L-serine dehydratase